MSAKSELIKNAYVEPTILILLRQATHDIHQRLHKHPLLQPLVQQSLTKQHYILLLQAFERFYQSVEKRTSSNTLYDDFQPNSNTITHDLITLGAQINPINEQPVIVIEKSESAILGMLYVLEGSKLGGQLIAQNIKNTLGYTEKNGTAFFYGNGKQTGEQWHRFLLLLDSRCTHHSDCINSACQIFEILEQWLWLVYKRYI
ncbi:biliverdin-producing heme oxygenase [Spartinivicinus poritis]|uniref:Biliverdin-producing heme oxygenase n=1 Tax=Spartinivicinus poritis TaxID=2994640 RepID=A0ABT5U360_9GAMM|nr:biliverdin-producing heme oxygenase [Spartinivicinus sp. A2-2]MDE1460809.1 biliverdin-producing heme oxygenase [Spartinivicinus sp. A2-2]